ncbi:MAG TPA: small ribosomal subunit Rsm22 family protein [Terriglobales bacterium]|nr:small ribosomal subunit Rsm22 family protein [Terriglobales bacterium]
MQLPSHLAAAIESLVTEHDFKQLRAAAERISEAYRDSGRVARLHTSDGAAPLLASGTDRAAYLAVRFPATYAAISAVLEELKARAPQFAPRTMLDLGAGPGTATLAALEQFPALTGLTLVERDASFLELGRRLAAGGSPQADRFAEDLRSAKMPSCDLAVAAYSLGELSASDAAQVVERAWKQLQVLCVIEPGTPRGYATIMRVRDQLIAPGRKPQEKERQPDGAAAGAPFLVAPCPHERRCPMDGTKDWCHFAARVERTSLHRKLKAGELGWEDEKFSYVIFARDPGIARAPARIVRHPQTGKGHMKLDLCGPEGLALVTISKKQGEAYRRARRAKWGDGWDI